MRLPPLLLSAVLALSACTASAGTDLAPLEAQLEPVPWEGGPGYYERFPAAAKAGWTKPSFFPVGVWYASVRTQADVDQDQAAGINTYVELTGDSDPRLVRRNRMSALLGRPLPGHGEETVGWLVGTEADMWGGPGEGRWTGGTSFDRPACVPRSDRCGYTAMKTLADRLPDDDRMRYATFGKGVMYWHSSEQAAAFVNDYTDAVSTSLYWYTDHAACDEVERFMHLLASQCRLAANYGATIARQRALDERDDRLQPIYAIVELGQPRAEDGRAITPEQVSGAVMSSLIHEARGVVYLDHSAGRACRTLSLLRAPCGARMRAAVTALNRRIRDLAPVLNTQSYRYGDVRGVDTMLKRHDGHAYLFAMPERGASMGPRTFTIPANLSTAREVEVLFEDRKLSLGADGRFTDSFDSEGAYHIYKIRLGEA
ncbi:hypothetical protein GCM10010404_60570 [Nonomuraea africana]|uniref:Lipoprotein n=1 Tax=Nonomuraea africana TaxID=46171 RepID=A0ABR9KTG4_9ACTN|nr:hypothetical protein [Nonomuraea africana]MBE1565020.1 hypothetical protein [Nonomuraea africana]